MRFVLNCEMVTKKERRKGDWQCFLILLRGSSIARSWPESLCQEVTWTSGIQTSVAVVFRLSEGVGPDREETWDLLVFEQNRKQDSNSFSLGRWKNSRWQQMHCRCLFLFAFSMIFLLDAQKGNENNSSWVIMFLHYYFSFFLLLSNKRKSENREWLKLSGVIYITQFNLHWKQAKSIANS